MFGMDLSAMQQQAQGALAAIMDKLSCLDRNMAQVGRMLSYEHGRPVEGVPGHDPRNLPYIQRVQLSSGKQAVDVTAALNKVATRGHITNLGNADANLYFERLADKAEQRQRVGPYILKTGTTLDLSFFLEIVEIEATAGAIDVQVFAQ